MTAKTTRAQNGKMTRKYENELRFNVAGTTFEGRQGKLFTLKRNQQGAYLVLRREEKNAYDENAVAVIAVLPNGTHMKVGYVPRSVNKAIAKAIDGGGSTRVRSFEIVGGKGFNYGCAMRVAY